MKVKITTTEEIEITPSQMAKVFYEMDESQHREFFEEMSLIWDLDDLESQVLAIKRCGLISDDALSVMNRFGYEYDDEGGLITR